MEEKDLLSYLDKLENLIKQGNINFAKKSINEELEKLKKIS